MPLVISIALHLILVIIMMFWVLPIMKAQPWYEVSWSEDPPEDEGLIEAVIEASPASSFSQIPISEQNQAKKAEQTPKQSSLPKGPKNPPVALNQGDSHPGRDELVEAPVFTPEQPAVSIPTSLRSNPKAVEALRETVSGVPGPPASGAVNADIEGGKLVRTDNKVRTHSLGDYGEVRLSFSVDLSAKLIESSIRVLQSNNSRFDSEAIKILKDMTFGFRGRPDADKPYTITIRFSP